MGIIYTMIKNICFLLIATFLGISGCLRSTENRDVLYQASTLNALLKGVYQGDITFKELRKHGDFGLGTFDGLEGEMIELDGIFYQIKADGVAYAVDDSMKTPFAVITFFEADKTVLQDKSLNYKQLVEYLDNLLPTKNIFYAIKINGVFSYIKTRSVPRQNKPYPLLVDALKNQTVSDLYNVNGTIVGFRFPDYMKGLNVPGYHFHFITEDRKAGGHLLDCEIQSSLIEIDYTDRFYMVLPEHDVFYRTDLRSDKQKEFEGLEK
jgi:acetolactate decarboxylase